jgi:hypothetical protein
MCCHGGTGWHLTPPSKAARTPPGLERHFQGLADENEAKCRMVGRVVRHTFANGTIEDIGLPPHLAQRPLTRSPR